MLLDFARPVVFESSAPVASRGNLVSFNQTLYGLGLDAELLCFDAWRIADGVFTSEQTC
jgi:hypothetical protein